MLQLNKQEKEIFLKLSRSSDAEILKGYVEKLISEITNVDNLSTDIIKNAQTTKAILKGHLLDHLTEQTIEEEQQDTYE